MTTKNVSAVDRLPIYVIDDEDCTRSSILALIDSFGFVARGYATAEAFLTELPDLSPGVAIVDLRLPGMGGLDLLEQLRPNFQRIRAIVLTGHGTVDAAIRALRLGAKDFLQKPFRSDELYRIIEREEQHLRGGLASVAFAEEARARLITLAPREFEVTKAVSLGQSNKQIAVELGLSPRTVDAYRASAMRRLGVRSSAELVRIVVHACELDIQTR